MLLLVHPCKSFSFPNSLPPLNNFKTLNIRLASFSNYSIPKRSSHSSFSTIGFPKRLVISKNFSLWGGSPITFCSRNDVFSSTHLPQKSNGVEMEENEELELLNKPSPTPMDNGSASEVDKESEKNEALAPFLKFFTPRDSMDEVEEKGGDELGAFEEKSEVDDEIEEVEKVSVEYYEPKPGDFVVGVVVSGNENKLDVNVGADLLGTMLTKEVLPLYDKEMEYLLCDTNHDAEDFMVPGKMGIVKSEAVSGASVPGKPVVETGTILFAEVLGRTLSGRPLLSTRRLFRRIAWHRVRQVLFLLFTFSVWWIWKLTWRIYVLVAYDFL